MTAESAITTYGERNPNAPTELDQFSFLIGKWNGIGKARLPDGGHAQFELNWIGRYILNGMAIADEFHSLTPDGKPYLGISLRQFDAQQSRWIIEYLNVTHSFIRRQVGPRSGSLSRNADALIVVSEDGQTRIREQYRVIDPDHFTYSTQLSTDGGQSWEPVSLELTMTRAG